MLVNEVVEMGEGLLMCDNTSRSILCCLVKNGGRMVPLNLTIAITVPSSGPRLDS